MSSKVNMPSPEAFDDEYDDSREEEELAKKNATRSMANNIGTLVGLVSLGMNAFQLVIMFFIVHSVSYVSTVASVIGFLVALMVVKRMIIDMAPTHTLRFIHNKLRRKVHHLYLANNQLKANVDNLETKVKSLQDVENQLADITAKQGANVDKVVKLVKENGQIVEDLTRAIKAQAAMTLVKIALDSDRDDSSLFTDPEIDMLLVRLGAVNGIQVNEPVLRENLKQDNSLSSVLAMLNYSSLYAHKYGPGVQPPMGETAPAFTFSPPQ